MSNTQQIQPNGGFGTPLINFQTDSLSIKEKSNFSFGIQLAQYIESTVSGGTSSYFFVRNQRWKINRSYANGKINMAKFQDLLEFNGKTNYLNLNWQCIHIVNRIISGLVGRWMNRAEKIIVTATDSLSTKQKQDEYDELEFIIENREKLEQLQAQSGVQMIPDKGIPADKEELLLWKHQFQRLPEEIGYEMGCNDVLASNGWFDVLKEKMLHDSAVTGFVGTYTYMDAEGVVHVECLKPENCFYSYSEFPDFRNTTWRGYMRTIKISELRKRYSQEFNPNNPNALTEDKIFDMARTAKEYQLYDNISWNTQWNVSFLRPYDEWNIDIMEFELKTLDNEYITKITTKKNGSTILKRGKPQKKADNEEVIDDSKINIYRGVYARTTQTMLEWGLKKNMIRPQDPKEIGNAEFSYSFYMVQNYDMTCLAVPEKIQEPADQMIIARLRIQQLVAAMRPTGSLVNWDALQNIDYGLGEGNKAIDIKKLYDQTGTLYYRGKDAEGNQVPVPITELTNSGFLPQLQGLILLYDKHYQIMKDELGEDPNLISQATQPRVAVQNIETSQQQAEFATDYFYNAYVQCMQDTAKKISCLLKDSVDAGAKVYRHIVGEDAVKNRIFSAKIQLLPDAIAIQKFELLLNQAIAANPDIILFLDPFQLMRVAKEDVKLAETLFRQSQKKMLLHKMQEVQQNQQATFTAQIESAKAAETEKRKTEADKSKMDLLKTITLGDSQSKNTVLTGIFNLYLESQKNGTQFPAELRPIAKIALENVAIPSMVENEERKKQILQEIDAMMQQEMQEEQGEQQGQPSEQQIQQQIAV